MSEYKPLTCLPVLPLRGLVVFPGVVTHFDVGRLKSAKSVEEAMRADQRIFLTAQKDLSVDDPKKNDLYAVGTVAIVKQILRMPGDNMRILVEGKFRAELVDCIQSEPYLFARVEEIEEPAYNASLPRVQALLRQAHGAYEQFVELAAKNLQDGLLQVLSSEDPGFVADFIAQNSSIVYQDKQKILEQPHPVKRLELTVKLLAKELEILQLENEISEKVQQNVNKGQRDYYLREQMHVIREELGEEDDETDTEGYQEKIRALKLPEQTETKLLKEARRLGKQQQNSAEAAVIRNYLDLVLELPWNTRTKERLDVKAAEKILDEDHFGLEPVKKRILETLAVRQLAPELPGQILCLVGPPGVGKTSIAISIARALNRRLARISLGGVHDEAEIRGHRKTYIGAMPGRIMTGISQAKSKNALLLLDEIDKLGSDYKGDPSSALLEVLDSAQNSSFRDHYIEVPFDLSECMFITTANTTDTIPRALLDRMEVIELGSYTDEEKLQIAKRHLHGLTEQLRQAVCHNLQGERGVWSVLGLAHVRAENHARAVLDEIFNCRQGGNNTLVARDLAVLGGDIEVAAAKNALAGNVDVFYGFLVVVHPDSSLYDAYMPFKTRANARLLTSRSFFPAPSGAGSPAAAAPQRHQLPRSFRDSGSALRRGWGFSRSYRNARQGNPPAVPSSHCRKTDNSRRDSPPRRSASALWWKTDALSSRRFSRKSRRDFRSRARPPDASNPALPA